MTMPLLKPSCTGEEIDAVTEVLKSGWWGHGPKCEEFESEIAAHTNYRYAVTVNSATAALHLALKALGIGPGDEVILPALTFISTALAVTYTGATPIFADVNADTLTINWSDVNSRCRSKKTKAVIPVDYAGHPAMGYSVKDGCELHVVQDAAHSAFGKTYGELCCYSFHPVKSIATGDGGVILTDNGDYVQKMKAWRWCGIDRSTYDRVQAKYNWDYNIHDIGYKYHWNDIQAAIGLVQMKRRDELINRRKEIAMQYYDGLKMNDVYLPTWHMQHTYHLFPVRVPEAMRDVVLDFMLKEGISVGVHYKPLTYYSMYRYQVTPPVTEQEWKKLISLPIYYDMTDADVEHVISTFRKAIDRCWM